MTYQDKVNVDIWSQLLEAFQHPIVPSEMTDFTQHWKTSSLEVPTQTCKQMQPEFPLIMNWISYFRLR